MPDFQQNKPKYQKYRYSISQLIELAPTAFLAFDLSKFSYDAARAGVVPSLGDCAMSSRKSSASCIRGSNLDTANSADVLPYDGNRLVRPDRQPNLPPPAERQKDEGFVKFLKKHSSPTHNRVTAGGRIVPMEPRSPPPFLLPANVTNRPQAVSAGQQFQDMKKNGNNDWNSYGGQDSRQAYLNYLSTEHRFLDAGAGCSAGPSGSPARAVAVNGAIHNTYDSPMTVNNVSEPTSIPAPGHSYFPAQHMGGPVMQQPMQVQPYGMSPYQSSGMLTVGMGVPVTEQYNPAAAWGIYNQSYQQYATQQAMTAHQLLAGWQQHYNQLDQQLKDIDRHRAMHGLAPHLAEQRRVIVQQRSDAKDTVREYQDMLGLKRMTDSSQESFATGFNVQAPAYVPASEAVAAGHLSHKSSFGAVSAMPVIEKPRGSAPRRAIPIVPPADKYKERDHSQRRNVNSSGVRGTNEADGWGVSKRPSPPEVRQEQSNLSGMFDAEQERQMSSPHESPAYMSESQGSGQSSEGVACNPVYGASEVALPAVIPAKNTPPRDHVDEYRQIIKAIGQPKGTVTKLRLINSSVMDVGGQDIDLSAVPLPSYLHGQNDWSKRDPPPSNSFGDGRMSNMPASPTPNDVFGGKENISVTAIGHKKAATDAFLAQFNAVEDSMALAAKLETQSLRTTSNSRVQQGDRMVVDVHGPNTMKMTSTEELARHLGVATVGAQNLRPAFAAGNGDHGLADPSTSFVPESLNNKGYSSVCVQNIHAVGSLPNSFDGVVEGRRNVQAQLATAGSKTRSPKSPRFLRRQGGNGGA